MARRIAFRFAFAYILAAFLPFPVDAIPKTQRLTDRYEGAKNAFAVWMGKRILHLDGVLSTSFNGSGDRTVDYLLLLCALVAALGATLIWTVLDRRRREYNKLLEWLRVYVRYLLAHAMLFYGFVKIFGLQFQSPAPFRFMESYGESSPMGLLWTFMGYSKAYSVFTGLAEFVAGGLLFVRSTVPLGALMVVAVMSNVVMLNFCYDVPVKIYSSHLLAMGIFLLAPDIRRLSNVLVLNLPTQARSLEWSPPFIKVKQIRWAIKVLFLGFIYFSSMKASLNQLKANEDDLRKGPLYGLFEVEDFVTRPAMAGAATRQPKRWRRVAINNRSRFTIRDEDDSFQHLWFNQDTSKKSFTIEVGPNRDKKFVLTYSQLDSEHLILDGEFEDHWITARLKKVDLSKSLLLSRGFHWITEVPYNR